MNFVKFFIAMGMSYIPGFFGRQFSPSQNNATFYWDINKSALTPPGFVFAIVWNILFFVLGIALYLVLSSKNKDKKQAVGLFIAHMILNGLWSFIYFGLNWPVVGLLNIIALIIVAIFMKKSFAAHNKYAGWMGIPYIVWLIFAMYLNLAIIVLN